jgi:murein L,D-transpeptidase YafK
MENWLRKEGLSCYDDCVKKLLHLFSALSLLSGLAPSVSAQTEMTEEAKKVIESADFFLLMVKQENKLSLRPFGEPQKALMEWRAITGSVPGDKEVEGDKKTPEGIYLVEQRIPKSMLQSLHGAMAFSLNYPNDYDRFSKKTGSGIWIHGVDKDDRMEKRFDTRGCIALANKDVTELGGFLHYGTPVIIIDKPEEMSSWKLERNQGSLVELVNKWAQAWSSREINNYISFYHPSFRSRGMDIGAWKNYKDSLNKAYQNISVELSNILSIQHPKYMLTLFRQKYQSNKYRAEGLKKLYWAKGESGDWKIVLEEGYQQQTGHIH